MSRTSVASSAVTGRTHSRGVCTVSGATRRVGVELAGPGTSAPPGTVAGSGRGPNIRPVHAPNIRPVHGPNVRPVGGVGARPVRSVGVRRDACVVTGGADVVG